LDLLRQPERNDPASPRRIEIELSNGCRIRMDEGVSLPALRRVLTALRSTSDSGRTSLFEAPLAELELALVDTAQQFDAGDGDRSGSEPLEAEHRSQPRFYPAMILLDQVG
jgi:hypothetical protein